MNKRMIRKKNKHVNHKLFQDLILKYLVPSGFHIDEQFWLSGYIIDTINTDSIVRFTLKELPQIYFGAFIDKESKTISICSTHEICYDKLKPSYCEFNRKINSPTDTLMFIDDLKEIQHKPWLVDNLTEDEFRKGFISIFLDENLLEKAYLNDPDLIGLVNPVLHTKLKSLSSLNHTQRITYINELYDEHWSDKHTTVIY